MLITSTLMACGPDEELAEFWGLLWENLKEAPFFLNGGQHGN